MTIIKNLLHGLVLAALLVGAGVLHAAEPTTTDHEADILRLSDSVDAKKTELEGIERRIDGYRKQIAEQQTRQLTLTNQLALIENRIVKAELDLEAATLEVQGVTLEIELLDQEIALREEQLVRERNILAELLREIHRYDDTSTFELLLGANTFSDVYTHLHFLEDVQLNLQETLD
ncbi:MAG: hypothetical protein HY460_01515, partial [Parcubacteria group bacterium]|nr:hypothetical protein [Parcubacteria group bacterium]